MPTHFDKRKTYRAWCWTLHPEKIETDVGECWKLPPEWDSGMVKYCVYQGEIGEGGKFHWQGYMETKNSVRLSTMKEVIPGAHLEPRKGTADEARNYCMKEESREIDPVEFGNFGTTKQGERTDWKSAVEVLKSGDWKNINPREYIKYPHGLMAYAKLMGYKRKDEEKRDPKTPVTVTAIIGKSGGGKSRWAMDMAGEDYYVLRCAGKNNGNIWWTGYDGQKTVIINDFHGQLDFDDLLSIIDRYPYQVPVHGNLVQLLATNFIITSTGSPDCWYPKIVDRHRELMRRIGKIVDPEERENEELMELFWASYKPTK